MHDGVSANIGLRGQRVSRFSRVRGHCPRMAESVIARGIIWFFVKEITSIRDVRR